MIYRSFDYVDTNLCNSTDEILARWGVYRNKPKNPAVSIIRESNPNYTPSYYYNHNRMQRDIYKPIPSKYKDDGKISFKEKMENFGKGLISPIKTAFSSPKNIALTLGTIALGATMIVATSGAAAPVFVAAGLISGGVQIGKGIYNQAHATKDEQARQAWQCIGSGTFAVGASAIGAKSALKTSGVNTEGMSTFTAVLKCLKDSPKNLFSSVKTIGGKLSGMFGSTVSASSAPHVPSGTQPELVEVEILDTPPSEHIPKGQKPVIIDVEYTVVDDVPKGAPVEAGPPKALPAWNGIPEINYDSLYNSNSNRMPDIDISQFTGERNLPAVIYKPQPVNNPTPKLSTTLMNNIKKLFNLFGFFTSK